ncbi:MAG: M81 family metallopeptidase [Anaerolineae bacterium]|nr:M81 family metallopeptidase [Anaerolineae bacterium]
MKIFIGSIWTETNTFSPLPTGYSAYQDVYLVHGGKHPPERLASAEPAQVFRRRALERGWQVIDSLHASAEAGGKTTRHVYESFREELLNDLRAALPVAMVFLPLHGAMVADGYDDCEGDLIARVRALVGQAALIGVQLDPHCHLSPAMVAGSSIIVMEKEYPHTDFAERAEDVFRLMEWTSQGRITPVMRVYDCRMIGVYQTTRQPMRDLVDRIRSLEQQAPTLSISIAHGFPWGDVPDMGTKVLVIADRDADHAAATARAVGRDLFALRHELIPQYLTVEQAMEAVQQALITRTDKPIVLADVTDNSGGGAPGDATHLLRAIFAAGFAGVLFGGLYDPQAVTIAHTAGPGARLEMRIGGKLGRASGTPLDVDAEIRWIGEAQQHFGVGEHRLHVPMGTAALIRAGGVDILLISRRKQVYSTDLFECAGVDPRTYRLVALKSSQHFYAAFAPLAQQVLYCAPPGALQLDFTSLPYQNIDRRKFPLLADPFTE